MAEIELKFEVPPEAHAAFRRLEPLRSTKPATAKLHAIYFDTPAFALRDRDMALRLRRTGRKWVQCLKSGRSGAGGLHTREEREFSRPDATLDISLFGDLPPLDAPLAEIFAVDVVRTTWQLEPSPGNLVEVALDRGEVTRKGGREAVSEVEIESLAGDPGAIFELAQQLVELVPMRPSATTKAQRGYRLARGETTAPAKARPVVLEASMSPALAARVVVAGALEQLQANDSGVLESGDPEYLHQLRVALRRLRSALRVFRDALDPAFASPAREELRWLAQEAGPARDWDVLATQTLAPLLAAFGESTAVRSARSQVAARRRDARERLRAALRSPRYARLVLFIAHWLAAAPGKNAGDEGLVDFASRVVRKRHRRLLAQARRLSILTPAQRHELRLEAKRLRYATEGFAALFRRKRVETYIGTLSDIQEDLGRANDAAVAARLLVGVRLPEDFAQFARGWLAAQTRASAADLGRHGERLAAAKPFW